MNDSQGWSPEMTACMNRIMLWLLTWLLGAAMAVGLCIVAIILRDARYVMAAVFPLALTLVAAGAMFVGFSRLGEIRYNQQKEES